MPDEIPTEGTEAVASGPFSELVTNVDNYLDFLTTPSNLAIVIALLIGLAIWMWSGCISSSIAENRLRSPWLHFFGGLTIPIVYPIVSLFVMTVATQPDDVKEEESDEFEKVEGPPPVDLPPAATNAEPELISEEAVAAEPVFNQAHFKGLMMDINGEYRGPFLFNVRGEELRVERIVDTLPAVVVTESVSSDGKGQRLRIPYEQIDGCTEI